MNTIQQKIVKNIYYSKYRELDLQKERQYKHNEQKQEKEKLLHLVMRSKTNINNKNNITPNTCIYDDNDGDKNTCKEIRNNHAKEKYCFEFLNHLDGVIFMGDLNYRCDVTRKQVMVMVLHMILYIQCISCIYIVIQ